ncbi:MAG: hypothetical protein ACI97A_004051, partial [Planctomycetota bacterium]
SPEASRATLIRRLSLDLTGLPPTPEAIDAFVSDASESAYEKLVDRLLSSEHYGERMAQVWLDAARYADTNGFHHDNIRTIWPYRDWVIKALNDNKPYDTFLVEQIAGDLLPNATEQQQIASAFCRLHNINDEGGALDAEYRVEAVVDRIETISTSVMGLTMTCARCHDHKYDPITQEDYFSLYAFFNSVDERGVYGNDFEQARAYPARLMYRSVELKREMKVKTAELAVAKKQLDSSRPVVAKELTGWEESLRERLKITWAKAETTRAVAKSENKFEKMDDGSFKFLGKTPQFDTHNFTMRTGETGLRLLRFEALPDASFPMGSVGLNASGNAVVSHISAIARSVDDPKQTKKIEFEWVWADYEQQNADHDVHNLLNPDAKGWALAGHTHRSAHTAILLSKMPFGFEGGTEIDVTVEYNSQYATHLVGRPRLSVARTAATIAEEFPTMSSSWFRTGPFKGGKFDELFDKEFGPEKVKNIDLAEKFGKSMWRYEPKLRDGKSFAVSGGESVFYFAKTLRTPVKRTLTLSLGSDDAIKVYVNGTCAFENKALRGVSPDSDKTEIELPPGENVLVIKIINNGGPGGIYCRTIVNESHPSPLLPVAWTPRDSRDSVLQERWLTGWSEKRSPTYARLAKNLDDVERAIIELDKRAVPILVMKEIKPQQAFVLDRGQYDLANKSRPVKRRPPMVLGGQLQEGLPKNRLGFAHWLTKKDHPLTARIHANRFWQTFFGIGIVKTMENFGRQADWPSHPELLDWLALQFVESGWDQKELIRLLVTSATYRQDSVVIGAAKEIDPENRLLAYFPRRRLTGEAIRDQALSVAGLLVNKIGGPSVRPYQPGGLWREVSIGASSNTRVFEAGKGSALYRRSLYTFWKRTSPNPQMTTFDAPSREFCVVNRNTTNTPLQALVLWNDIQFLEAARVFAQRTLSEAKTTGERLTLMFRRATGRKPNEHEASILNETLEAFLERFGKNESDAVSLLTQGSAPLPMKYEAPELASWMMIANTILSLDEVIVRD